MKLVVRKGREIRKFMGLATWLSTYIYFFGMSAAIIVTVVLSIAVHSITLYRKCDIWGWRVSDNQPRCEIIQFFGKTDVLHDTIPDSPY
jgi:hypothetical protein